MTSDHTIETLRSRLKLKEAQLVKKMDKDALQLSQSPQTSLYKRHDLEILKILRDLRRILSRTAS